MVYPRQNFNKLIRLLVLIAILRPYYPLLITLALGLLGAGLAPWLYLPVPALLGSAILVSIVAFTRIPLAMPNGLRNIGFTILGTSMGSGITPEMLSLIGQWPLSLLALTLTVCCMMWLSTWVLVRYFKQSPRTALLASTPGALSTVVALAGDGNGDVRAVVVLQSLRLLLVMAVLPITMDALGFHGSQTVSVLNGDVLAWHIVLLLLLGAFGLALLLERLKIPAAYVLGGILLSGSLHASAYLHGALPRYLIALGLIIIGCVVGVRFKGVRWPELKQFAAAALVSVSLSSLIAALAAALVAWGLKLPFGQVWVAYAPGGVEAMSALALALHYDPAYIAAHHLSRIVGLTLTLPWVMRRIPR